MLKKTEKFLCVLMVVTFFLTIEVQARGWAVAVGIDKYNSRNISALLGAGNDARNLASTIRDVFLIPEEHIFIYTSDDNESKKPTTGNIVKALKFVAQNAKPDDLFVFAFSGHGISSGDRSYLLTYYSEVGALSYTAFDSNQLMELMDNIKATKKLIFMDACRNNPEKGKGDESNFLSSKFARGIKINTKNHFTLENILAALFSCEIGERAYEWPEKNRGFFSYYLERGLRGEALNDKGSITLGSLTSYLRREVPKAVKLHLGIDKRQRPFVDMSGGDPANMVLYQRPEENWKKEIIDRQKRLDSLKKLKEQQEAEREKLDREETEYQATIAKYDAEIKAMQSRLGTADVRTGDSLDNILSIVKKKEEQQFQFNELKKKRTLEEKKRKVEISKLQQEERQKLLSSVRKDIQKYDKIISSPFGKKMKEAAWKSLCAKYPDVAEGLDIGDCGGLLFRASGGWKEPVTGMDFVWVSGDCYQMGSNLGDSDEKPIHEVCVDGFWIGRFEVTQGQWKKVMGANPSGFKRGDNYPVEQISWNDVKEFINKLRYKNNNRFEFRLPTEAEWEYAARSRGKNETYAGGEDADSVAWHYGNSGGSTHPVDTKTSNGLGIYAMSGNVREWCQDIYSKEAYVRHPHNNPIFMDSGSTHVIRGGSWGDEERSVRCANRNDLNPDSRSSLLGFRLVRTK